MERDRSESSEWEVFPCLTYDEAPAAIDWLVNAFGFVCRLRVEGAGGRIEHSELGFGRAVIMVSSPKPVWRRKGPRSLGGLTGSLAFHISDPDGHCSRARAAGAKIVREPEDEPYGGRGYQAEDPEGHLWYFGTYRPGAHWSAEP